MGANPKQAIALLLFLVAFTAIGAALFAGPNALLIMLGLVLMGVSIAIFLKAKPLEDLEG